MTLEDRVQAQRLHVFRRAEELGNVSAACREAGVSRTLFYRWKRDYEAYGAEALHPRLTERTRKLREVRRKKRHVEARLPGDLVCIDCFYIGKLKGVGRVWQLTACDAASSFGAARVVALRQPTAKALERFLREVLMPLYRQAGWPIAPVLAQNR